MSIAAFLPSPNELKIKSWIRNSWDCSTYFSWYSSSVLCLFTFLVICWALCSSVQQGSWYRVTEEGGKRKSCLTPNSSWGSPGNFQVKSSQYRVALSPFLHRLTSDYFWVLTLGFHVQLEWHFGISEKMGEGCPQCVAIKANKGRFCQVLFFQTFFGWICEVDL